MISAALRSAKQDPASSARPHLAFDCRARVLWLAGLSLGLGTHVGQAAAGQAVALPPASARATAEVFFSPDGRADQAIADVIGAARQRVWVAGYYFTSTVIAKAIDQAHRRKIDVRVVLDRSQATLKYSSATYFHNQKIPLWINARYPLMHHKFVVVDADTVGLGSMNFTRAGAQQNADNFNLFRRWPAMADTYAREFQRLQQESLPYRPGMQFERDGTPLAEPAN
ncbi:phospholipase D family nuclease [Variovorax ginsengisoli]|uniref:phospholipase D n=1 Tax=Variovorax ginsengisoli TaxID=363844 RepID=A0ABT9SAW0_9BURK|nr:phospholipase D family protein [Variovorax ginsengisoli]MDP9901496.1 phosphatidylserine/phosphatidylglycerophosphate/cardiolipin synthase-like enzyme [Variovorax ginsengisoli]